MGTGPDPLIPRDFDDAAEPRVSIASEHAIAVHRAAVIGRHAGGRARWYLTGVKAPAVALIGSEFVAVVMPLFDQWADNPAQTIDHIVSGSRPVSDTEAAG